MTTGLNDAPATWLSSNQLRFYTDSTRTSGAAPTVTFMSGTFGMAANFTYTFDYVLQTAEETCRVERVPPTTRHSGSNFWMRQAPSSR
ncbi:hypothetical protein [Knoellia remsis]|uniref:hypothetical protein n=1 Tax=Knoellia remsis TaxID=407159 RepID=UPI001C44082B|nr:hypothetical protein [Knoellia remsis]